MELPVIRYQDQASMGWRTAEDQEMLYAQRVAVVGAGGAGGAVAESLACEGVQLNIADPDNFDLTNINRQTGANTETVGMNKARVVGEMARKTLGEYSNVRIFDEGLHEQNLGQVVEGSTAVLDAIDVARPDLSLLLARKAREIGVPLFMGIEVGYGCSVICFEPDAPHEETVEDFFGLAEDINIEDMPEIPVENMLVHIPSYTPPGMIEAFTEGRLPATPGIRPGVQLLGAAMTSMITRRLLNKHNNGPDFVYPNMYVLDPIDGMMVLSSTERKQHLATCVSKLGGLATTGFSHPQEYLLEKNCIVSSQPKQHSLPQS
jgi:molybdopterin/thiamine biosynthesis adenylyltransferase